MRLATDTCIQCAVLVRLHWLDDLGLCRAENIIIMLLLLYNTTTVIYNNNNNNNGGFGTFPRAARAAGYFLGRPDNIVRSDSVRARAPGDSFKYIVARRSPSRARPVRSAIPPALLEPSGLSTSAARVHLAGLAAVHFHSLPALRCPSRS